MVIFSVFRLLFWASNAEYFNQVSIWPFLGGLRFDLSSLLLVNLPLIILSLIPIAALQNSNIYRQSLRVLFVLLNAFAFAIESADIEYYKFTLKRSTFDLFTLIGTGDDMSNLLPVFIRDYWYLILLWLAVVFVLWRFGRRTFTRALPIKSLVSGVISVLLVVAFLSICVLGFRGGFQLKPLSVISASAYGGNKFVPLTLNSSFAMIKSYGKKRLPEINEFEDTELSEIYEPIFIPPDSAEFYQRNVVLIILESFAEEYIGELSGGESFTPFLDSLIRAGSHPEQGFANGRKSIEAVPALISGIPAWMTRPYISSPYASNQIESLPKLLSSKGYYSVFYHGGNNGTMGFDKFALSAEFREYVGRNEYPGSEDDYDGQWGIFDEPFLQFSVDHMSELKEPFFSTIFTLSSHHPYTIPTQYSGQFREGSLPIHPTVQYVDQALRKFFLHAKDMPWYQNSIFVITADHTHHSVRERYLTKLGQYRVPIILFEPGKAQRDLGELGQHIDLMPTILDMVGFDNSCVSFGKSLIREEKTKYVMNYLGGQYQIYDGRFVGYVNGAELMSLYDYESDSLLSINLADSMPLKAEELRREALARIQSFNERMNSNQLSKP